MLDPLGSTSWHHRHLAAFRRLDELLRAEATGDITVMIVGPGGVTRLAAPLLNDADCERSGRLRRLVGDAARYGDQVLRRLPGMPLRSLEPVEVSRTLTVSHELVVVDRSQRVLDAVARDLPAARCRCLDISFQPIEMQADVVIAFNIVCRLGERAPFGMAHLAAAVRENGWLLMDDRSAAAHLGDHPDFVPVASKTYRRLAGEPDGVES